MYHVVIGVLVAVVHAVLLVVRLLPMRAVLLRGLHR